MSAVVTEPQGVISPEQRQAVFALYDQGLYLQAYELARSFAPLHEWRGTDARILAGRMAGNLGSQRLGDHFGQTARIRCARDDAGRLGGDRRTNRFLLGRNVTTMK